MTSPDAGSGRGPLIGGLAWRLAVGFVVVTVATLVIVLVVVDRLTTSAFGSYVGHAGMMRGMMGAGFGSGGAAAQLPDPAEFTNSVHRSLLLVGAGGVAVAAVVGVVIARRLTRPVRAMERAAQRIAAGDTSARVPRDGDGELGALADSFNAMASSLAAASEARKQFLASVAHELRTPLAVLQGEIEALQDGVIDPGPEPLEALAGEVRLLGRIVGDLHVLALADAGELRVQPAPEPLVPLLEAAVSAMRDVAAPAGVTIALDVAAAPPAVRANHARIDQVLRNLLANAVRHTPAGGTVTVRADRAPDGAARIAVEDTGPGIAADDLPHVFDRFYRAASSAARGGSGLGLAIVRELVAAHGGDVRAENRDGAGARFTFTLPVAVVPAPVPALVGGRQI